MPYASIVGAAALWFGLVGPAVPLPAMALRAFWLSGTFDRALLLQSLELYLVALLLGGALAAATVGLVYGAALSVIDRFWPRLLLAPRRNARVAKALLFPLAFTVVLGGGGSLVTGVVLRTLSSDRFPVAPPFQVLGDPVSFAAPTLLCGILFAYWVLPRLPGQLGLLARRTDGEIRQPRADHVPEEKHPG